MFAKISSHLGIYKKFLAAASILSILGNSLLYAEVYYPQNGAFIPKKYTMVHGVGTPNQSIDITEKGIILCSTTIGANGEWECPLLSLTDGRHDFIIKEHIIAPGNIELVADVNTGAIGSSPKYFTYSNNAIYFSAYNPTYGTELWRAGTDGTGATLVTDIASGALGSFPNNLMEANDTLYFAANDTINGQELWSVLDASSPANLAFDLVAGTGGSNPSFLSNIKDTLYFMAEDSAFGGVNIWNIDAFGFPSLTVSPTFHPLIFLSNHPNGEMYFASKPDGMGYELSWYNTQTRSSYKFNIASGSTDAFPFYGIFAKNDFYFHANDGIHGSEVWKTSVGSTGAVLAADIMSGTGMSSEPRNFTNVNGTLYFTANDGIHGVELWRIKETGEISMVKDIRPGYESGLPKNLTNAYGTLYFTANDGIYGEELWKINKEGDAEIVEDILAGSGSSGPSDLLSVHGSLYFTATNSGTLLGKLYKTTPSGGVEQLAPNITIQKKAAHLTYTDYGIYFAGDDGSKGVEPYRIPLDVYTQEMPYTVVVGNIPMDIKLSSPINTGSLITNTFSEKSFPVLIESSEVLGSVSLTGIQVENGNASNLRRIGNNYAFDVTPFTNVNSGILSVWIGTGAIRDMYDDPFMQASNALNWYMDTDEPHAILLIPENPSKILTGGVLQNGMNIRVYSSERLEDFTLSDISASGANISNLVWNSLGYYSFQMLPKTQSGNIDISIGTGTVQDLAGNTNLESSNILHWEINTSPAPQAFITSVRNKERLVGENLTITGITASGNTTSLMIQGNGNPSTIACSVNSPYYGGSIFECPLPATLQSGNYKINTQTCDPYGNCGIGNVLDIEINTNAGNLYTYSRLQHSVNTTTNEHTFTLSVEYGENKGIPMVQSYIDIALDPNVDFKEAYFITSSGSSRKISFIPSAYANEVTAYGEYNPGTHTYHVNLGKISAHEHGTITIISELTEGINAKDVMLSFETTLKSTDETTGTIQEENSEDNIAKSHYLLGENDLMEIYFGKISSLTTSHSSRCSNYEIITDPTEIITRDIKNHWAGEYIANLTQYGIIGNNPYFSPDKQVTRAEFISMLVRGLSCNYTSEDLSIMSSTFEDIPTNSNISRYVGMAESLGWIKNRTGYFRPNDPISRGESVDMLMTALGELDYTSTEFDDIGQASLFKRAILSAKYLGIINGQYTNGLSLFFPNKELMKSESAKMLSKAFFPSFSGGIVNQLPTITTLPQGTTTEPTTPDTTPPDTTTPTTNNGTIDSFAIVGSNTAIVTMNKTYTISAMKGGAIDTTYSGSFTLSFTPSNCATGGGTKNMSASNLGTYTFSNIQFTSLGTCTLQVTDARYGISSTLQVSVTTLDGDGGGDGGTVGAQSITITSPANNITLPANYGYINGTSSYPGGLVRISINGTIVANGNANSSGNYSIYVNNLATTNTIQAILIHPTSGAELARSANSTINTR